jgi:phage recombination protein Bet
MPKEKKKEVAVSKPKENALVLLAERLKIDANTMKNILRRGAFKECITDEELMGAIVIANTYGLNPLLNEIYVYPANNKLLHTVPIDGWIKIVNRQKSFNGVELIENEAPENDKETPGGLKSVTATFYRKDTDHPVVITEYMNECYNGKKVPWQKWPRRMLRHKAYIQGGRLAYGLAGIYSQDEAERIIEAEIIEEQSSIPHPEITQPKELPKDENPEVKENNEQIQF